MVESGSSIVLSLQPPTHYARNKNYKNYKPTQNSTLIYTLNENYHKIKNKLQNVMTKKKKEVTLSSVHTMIAYRGSRGTAPLMHNLGTRCRRVVNYTPQLLYPPKKSPCTH
jgi:hypothetical protein